MATKRHSTSISEPPEVKQFFDEVRSYVGGTQSYARNFLTKGKDPKLTAALMVVDKTFERLARMEGFGHDPLLITKQLIRGNPGELEKMVLEVGIKMLERGYSLTDVRQLTVNAVERLRVSLDDSETNQSYNREAVISQLDSVTKAFLVENDVEKARELLDQIIELGGDVNTVVKKQLDPQNNDPIQKASAGGSLIASWILASDGGTKNVENLSKSEQHELEVQQLIYLARGRYPERTKDMNDLEVRKKYVDEG